MNFPNFARRVTSRNLRVSGYTLVCALIVLSAVSGSQGEPSKARKAMIEETNLCRNAQLLFDRFDIGIQEDNEEGLLRYGNTKPVTPTAEIREAWSKDIFKWIDRTSKGDQRIRDTHTASSLAVLVWECEQAARGYFRESKDPGRKWQADGHLDSFNEKFKRLQDICPDIRLPVYLTAKLGSQLAKRAGRKYEEDQIKKQGKKYADKKYAEQGAIYAAKMAKREKLEICTSAQQLIKRVSKPMMKYQGTDWHDNSWRNYHNEIAHGQDLSRSYCKEWANEWERKVGSDQDAAQLARNLSTAIHNLYNAAYDSAHNASRGYRGDYDRAQSSFNENKRRIKELCSSLSVPDMLAAYPRTRESPPPVTSKPPAPPPTPTDSHGCSPSCPWNPDIGGCDCQPQQRW